jgi:hypothetical protein
VGQAGAAGFWASFGPVAVVAFRICLIELNHRNPIKLQIFVEICTNLGKMQTKFILNPFIEIYTMVR